MKLHQLIAIEKGERDQAKTAETEAYHAIQALQTIVGISRRYTPDDADGDQLPEEHQLVQTFVTNELTKVREALIPYWDIAATKDATNTIASANVVVNGETVLEKVPIPTLLWLEKQLVDLRTVFSHLPQLDPSREWTLDPNSGAYRDKPEETIRTKKVPKHHVLYEATKEHPAQIREYTDDVKVGRWTTTHFSGALPAQRILELRSRVTDLLRAVQIAREEANSAIVVEKKIGESVFDFILAP